MADQRPVLNYDMCYGCKACLINCPTNVFELKHTIIKRGMIRTLPSIINTENCIGCGLCARYCPVDAISMVKQPPKDGKKAIYINYDNPLVIDADECRGCTACKRICPMGAIDGEVKKAHKINEELCIRCGLCMSKCKFNAISN